MDISTQAVQASTKASPPISLEKSEFFPERIYSILQYMQSIDLVIKSIRTRWRHSTKGCNYSYISKLNKSWKPTQLQHGNVISEYIQYTYMYIE